MIQVAGARLRRGCWVAAAVLGVAGVGRIGWAEPPRLVWAQPDHGDTGVDPATATLRFVFDQDMRPGSFSICGGGPEYPALKARPRWASPRELVCEVKLEAGHAYKLSLNCASAKGLASVAGEALEPTPIWFQTAAQDGEIVKPPTEEENWAAAAALQKAVDGSYSYRDRVVKDWAARFEARRGALEQAKSRAAFAREAGLLLAGAEDIHVTLSVGDVRFASARRRVPANVPAAVSGIDGLTDLGEGVFRGRTPEGVAYVRIDAWTALAASRAVAALHGLRGEGAWKGCIVDVRRNSGGDETAALAVAGMFADHRAVYSRDRVRMGGEWQGPFERVVEPGEGEHVPGPVVVLMGRYCMSTCESFVLMMKHGAGATLVGERTYGSSGNPRPHDLGQGVTAWLSSWEDLTPQGEMVEGRGVAADVEVALRGEGDAVLARGVAVVLGGKP